MIDWTSNNELEYEYRLGERVPFDKETETFSADKPAGHALEDMKPQLADDADIKLADTAYRLGRFLRCDAESEVFIGDEEANQMLTRPDREPFAVPEQLQHSQTDQTAGKIGNRDPQQAEVHDATQ